MHSTFAFFRSTSVYSLLGRGPESLLTAAGGDEWVVRFSFPAQKIHVTTESLWLLLSVPNSFTLETNIYSYICIHILRKRHLVSLTYILVRAADNFFFFKSQFTCLAFYLSLKTCAQLHPVDVYVVAELLTARPSVSTKNPVSLSFWFTWAPVLLISSAASDVLRGLRTDLRLVLRERGLRLC